MKRKFTRLLKMVLGAMSLGAPLIAQAAYNPIALTGFTADIIANGTGAVNTTTTADIDGTGTGYCLMAQNYVGPAGQAPTNATYPALENNGLITSAITTTPGLTFQLGSYSANNALRLVGTGVSGTLAFVTPQSAGELYVLGTSGNATSSLTITVTFTDATTQVFTSQSIADWFATGQTNVARQNLGRVSRSDNTVQYTSTPVGPRLYQVRLALLAANYGKLIQSITFLKPLVAGNAMILAVSANPACTGTPTPGTTVASVASACSSTSIALSLNGATNDMGTTYQWQRNTSGTWADISGATAATYTATGQTVETQYRAKVTCSYSALFDYSAPVTVTQNPFYNCYCANTSTGSGEYIRSVTFPGTPGFTNATNASSTGGYGDFSTTPALTTTLNKGGSYPLTITVQANASGSQGGLWIDYDHNGTFDTSEYTPYGSSNLSAAVTFNTTLVIPNTAAVLEGVTRVRVRWRNSAMTSATACTTGTGTWFGETEDYLITIGPSNDCNGTPTAGTATTTVTTICPGTAFSLSATGYTSGVAGLTFQWQSSPAGANNFIDLGTVQTAPAYAVASQSAATDYRVIVTCTNSGLSATSAAVSVAQNPFLACYCTPTYASGGANDYVGRVRLGTLDYSTAALGNVSPYYQDYSSVQNAVPDLVPGSSATVLVTFGSDGSQYSAVWIDFNHNGVFDASEYFTQGTNAGASGTATITVNVPIGALTGQTKMRIRGGNDSQPTSAQACGASNAFGEGEDYLVNVVTAVACVGTPPATTATASSTSVCASTGFTLSATGITPGTSGLTYQWQSSPAGANNFIDLGTIQTGPNYTVASLSASTDYRVVVVCTNSGLSTTSSIISVARGYLNCYCTVVSTGSGEYIRSVTFPGAPGFTNTTNANSTGGTGDFTTNAALTTTLNQGATYASGVSLTVHTNSVGAQGGMWIDYDHSGTFDASEYVPLGSSNLINSDVTIATTLTVPATALTGQTRVRVRWRNSGITGTDACTTGTTTWYGETEDYFITIAAPATCSAPPSSVVVTASTLNACTNSSFTLSTNSIPTTLGGYTFQWQSSVANAGTFTDISGATAQTYTVISQTAGTDYRLIVGCQYGGSPVTSNVATVGQNPFDQCYCTTSSTGGCGTYGSISNVSLGTINNSSTCAASTYTVYPATPTTTTNLNSNTSATLSLTIANPGSGYRYGVWIDFNQNGTFDASEFVASSTNSTTALRTATIAIPATALPGATRMRVRTKAGIASYGDFGAGDACTVQFDGETEDYTVTIVAPVVCSGTPSTTASANATSVCGGTSFILSATNSSNATGLTFQWQSSPAGAGTFTDISGAATQTYTVASQTAATDYRAVVTCTNSSLSQSSNVVAVAQNTFVNCYCTPAGGACANEYIRSVTLNTLSNVGTGTAGTGCTGTGYTDYTTNTALTTTLNQGATYSLAVNLRINSNPAGAGVWIDYDHSGTFDASEYTPVYSNTAAASNLDVSASVSIVIPTSALTGATRMRVRSANSSVPVSAATACPPNPYYGEIEDYLVTIASPVADLVVSTAATIPAGTYNNVTVTGTGNGTLTGATVVNGTFAVLPGGTLNTACQPLTGSGTFALAANATLNICSPQGITLSGATGAIQTATRQFSVAGTYVYNGGASQVTGSALPAQVRNLTVIIPDSSFLNLSQPVAIRRLLTLTRGTVLNGQRLTLRSDADSTALVSVGNGTVSGSATVQRYISAATNPGLGYRHFSAPVTNTTVADLATASFSPSVSQGAAYNASATPGLVTPFPTVFGYTEARQATSPATGYSLFDRGWQAPTATSNALQSGKGYTVNLAGGQMVDFVGTLGNGNVAQPLTRGTTTDAGWNLVGNPYPSTLNWDNVTIPTGMDAAVYVYQSASQYAGSYTSYTNGLGTSGGRTATIGMGQAFFVRVSPGTTNTTLTLTNAARSTDFGSGGNFQRGNDTRPRIRLALESATSSLTDAAYVYFEAGATTGIDARYDAVKLANPTGLSLSAVAAGTDLAINGLPLASTATTVPLTVAVPQAGTYTLRADELLNLTNGPVYLLDALTGQQVDLLQQPSYSFSATGATRIAGRFSLGFPAAGPLATQPGLSAASVSVYPNPAHTSFTVLVPAVPGAKQVQMALFNSLGQRVREQAVTLGTTGAQATVEVKDLAAGIYTLRLQVAGQAAVARRVAVE